MFLDPASLHLCATTNKTHMRPTRVPTCVDAKLAPYRPSQSALLRSHIARAIIGFDMILTQNGPSWWGREEEEEEEEIYG